MMSLNFNQIVVILIYMALFTVIMYVCIYRRFNKFILVQKKLHESAVRTANNHHESSREINTEMKA